MNPRYEVQVNSPGPANPSTYLVRDRLSGRWLGGVGASFYRPWVFPLYTPSGLTVIQEFAYDHPFHNGLFVGQHPVNVAGRTGNFWATPPRRAFDDAIWTKIGRMDVTAPPAQETDANGCRFVFKSVWRDEEEQPLIEELRTVRFHALEGAHVVDVASVKTAAYGSAEFPKTKYGSIGVRVEPRLLPPLGGAILADGGRRGTAALMDANRQSDFVAYENTVAGQAAGLFLTILDPGVRGPWFIRDYGMAMYNPTWDRTISLAAGESWTVTLRAVAYDGALTSERMAEWTRQGGQQ